MAVSPPGRTETEHGLIQLLFFFYCVCVCVRVCGAHVCVRVAKALRRTEFIHSFPKPIHHAAPAPRTWQPGPA